MFMSNENPMGMGGSKSGATLKRSTSVCAMLVAPKTSVKVPAVMETWYGSMDVSFKGKNSDWTKTMNI